MYKVLVKVTMTSGEEAISSFNEEDTFKPTQAGVQDFQDSLFDMMKPPTADVKSVEVLAWSKFEE